MKKSPFRSSSSNQEGFGIERNNKRKPSKKRSTKRKKPVAKKQGTSIARKTEDKDLIVQNFGDNVFAGIKTKANPEGNADLGSGNKAPQQITYEVNPDGSYRQIVSTKGYYDSNLGEYIPDNVVIGEGMNIMDTRLVNPVTGMPVGEELFGDNPGNYFGTYQGAMEGPVFQSFSGSPMDMREIARQEALKKLEQGNKNVSFQPPYQLAAIKLFDTLKEAKKQGNFTKE